MLNVIIIQKLKNFYILRERGFTLEEDEEGLVALQSLGHLEVLFQYLFCNHRCCKKKIEFVMLSHSSNSCGLMDKERRFQELEVLPEDNELLICVQL